MRQTRSIHTILEVCEFRFLPVSQLRLPCRRIVTRIRIDLKLICIDCISSSNETRNRNWFQRCAKSDFGSFAIGVDIFSHGRMPILAVSRLRLIDPSSIEYSSACFLVFWSTYVRYRRKKVHVRYLSSPDEFLCCCCCWVLVLPIRAKFLSLRKQHAIHGIWWYMIYEGYSEWYSGRIFWSRTFTSKTTDVTYKNV